MKKLLSLFIVVAILSLSCMTAFAAIITSSTSDTVVGDNSGMVISVVEKAGNIFEVTASVVGTVKFSAATFAFTYNKAKVLPYATSTTSTLGDSRLSNTDANPVPISPYFSFSSSNIVTDFAQSGTLENRAAASGGINYFAVTLSRRVSTDWFDPSDFVKYGGTATKVDIFTAKFIKVSGTVDVDTFGFSTVTASAANFKYASDASSTNIIYPTAFTKTLSLLPTGFNVDYVEAGGSPVTDLTAVTVLPATLPTTTRDGYIFDGWYYANDTKAQANDVISANTTLTAKWTVAPITAVDPIGDAEGKISKEAVKADVTVKNASGQDVVINAPVIAITGKVPASVTEANIASNEFGVIFGGVKFKSMSTWAGLSGNAGKYIIKLVDPTGKLSGTYAAKNYLNAEESGDTTVTIGN